VLAILLLVPTSHGASPSKNASAGDMATASRPGAVEGLPCRRGSSRNAEVGSGSGSGSGSVRARRAQGGGRHAA
jgi:hypothetical protein